MAKIAVRDLASGTQSSMSLSRAREAVAAGTVAYVKAPAKKAGKKVAKKATKKAAKKTTAKAVAGSRTRSMAGRTSTK